ncbi:MAG TPA: DUF4199 domain-containing protein [Opitutaceae bacterium]|nr:DUF4199 domain-containing protein [Opitutaceae bacterium]
MKTYLTYGALLALVGALLTFGLYLTGFHDTTDKLKVAQWIGFAIGLPSGVACLALAMRERRNELPAGRTWGYGPAFVAGLATAGWASFFGAIVSYIYLAFVNPQMSDLAYQLQIMKLEQKGVPQERIDAAASMMHRFLTPGVMTISQTIGGFIGSVLLALIVAIFFRKAVAAAASSESATPPPLS